MSERKSYSPGTPCWVALEGTPDIEASAGFYGALFGWDIPELPNSAELGGYRRAKKAGRDVAGFSPRMQDDQPTVWSTYVSVTDAAATAAAVAEHGGAVLFEPMDVMGLGHMAVFADPAGAVFGAWQPGTFAGAELVDEAAAFGWSELGTRDTAGARRFYPAVFGWDTEEESSARVGTYTVWTLDGAMVAGMIDIDALDLPAEVPPHWLVYFGVDDADAAIAAATANGGEVRMGPIDIPVGRFAVLADPHGAVFAVMQPSE